MFALILITLSLVTLEVAGHGMMLHPPGRSSRWRFDQDAPVNYGDNQLFCGGLWVLWGINKGNCGVCGDVYTSPHPQANENTGTYGTGVIVGEYKAGDLIETSILLTANHKEHFEYHLCKINDSSLPESGEECFVQLKFENGDDKFPVSSDLRQVKNKIQLPDGFKCQHCVLRWHYRAGNNWGVCDDGTSGMGCGPQEFYRSCADIRIV